MSVDQGQIVMCIYYQLFIFLVESVIDPLNNLGLLN